MQATRSPLVPIILALGVISLSIIWLTRPTRSAGMLSASSTATSLADTNVRVVVDGVDRTEALREARAETVATRNPRTLSWSDVDYITQKGSYPVLVFTDGSELPVDAYVHDVLPSDIRFRIDYEGP